MSDMMDVIELASQNFNRKSTENAYGKEMSEKDFEAISPDDDEYWFDDYDFVFMADVESEDMDDAEMKKILREKINCLV